MNSNKHGGGVPIYLVVQTDPGPMPILMMSAPANSSSSTISPVTTLPASAQLRKKGWDIYCLMHVFDSEMS